MTISSSSKLVTRQAEDFDVSRISALGYVGIGATDLGAWRAFGTDVLGLQVTETLFDEATLYLRSDSRAYRFVVTPGEDRLEFAGWQVATPQALDGLIVDLDQAGVAWKEDAELARRRRVQRLVVCEDPAGLALEFFVGAREATDRFVSPTSARFVTTSPDGQDLGLGHLLVNYPQADEALDFYAGVLGFKITDTITIEGKVATFLHVNPRHHSLAIMPVPSAATVTLNHFMLEVSDVDTVGRGLDRARDRGVRQFASLGRHSNDEMLSFYMASPSGFGVEYGCEGKLIDDATWTVADYDSKQYWGFAHPE
jgi:3,4-dihydroxy-9,10-secoandrosta-1,3,5(10)-triene-9,17-dione 4,5-dioxygenase